MRSNTERKDGISANFTPAVSPASTRQSPSAQAHLEQICYREPQKLVRKTARSHRVQPRNTNLLATGSGHGRVEFGNMNVHEGRGGDYISLILD